MRLLCLVCLTALACVAENVSAENTKCLRILDGTLYLQKPDLSAYGVQPIVVASGRSWLPRLASSTAIPERDAIQAWFTKVTMPASSLENRLVIDLEHWSVDGHEEEVRQSVQSYMELLSRVRETGYTGKIGYYGLPPIRDYWHSIKDVSSDDYRGWQKQNDALKALADSVDILFPSLYTFYDDREGWVRYAKANLNEARRVAPDKPIFPFIWPQYHEANKNIGLEYLPRDFWRLQLETIAQYADGVVLWGGYKTTWDPEAPWWQETLAYLANQPASCREPMPPKDVAAR